MVLSEHNLAQRTHGSLVDVGIKHSLQETQVETVPPGYVGVDWRVQLHVVSS